MVVITGVRVRIFIIRLITENCDQHFLRLLGIIRLIMKMDQIPSANLIETAVKETRAFSVNGKHSTSRRPKNISDLHTVGERTLPHSQMRVNDNRRLAPVRRFRAIFNNRICKGRIARNLGDDIGNDNTKDHRNNISRAAKRFGRKSDRRNKSGKISNYYSQNNALCANSFKKTCTEF